MVRKPEAHDVDLRAYAAHHLCQVRLPGGNCGDPNDCVLAHLQYPAGIRGMGQKAPDLLGTHACTPCHDEIDRRTRRFPVDVARMAAYEGTIRTQQLLIEEGVVRW